MFKLILAILRDVKSQAVQGFEVRAKVPGRGARGT